MEKHKICKLIIQKIKQYLSSPDCLQAHREKNHFIRKRKLSMLHLVTYLFYTTKASIVYDVLDDYIVHASLQKYIGSERAAAREHMKTLDALNIYENSVIVFDRGYYSEDMFRLKSTVKKTKPLYSKSFI